MQILISLVEPSEMVAPLSVPVKIFLLGDEQAKENIFPRRGVADGVRTHDNWNHNPGLYR